MTTYIEFITLYKYLNVVLYIDIGIMIVYNRSEERRVGKEC